jgi:asparaginyl-tRNA synthetase
MVEPEVAYADLNDVMILAEGLVVSVIARVLERRQRELQTLARDTSKLERIKGPFPRLSYDDAAAILKKKGLPFEWGGDFGAPDETALSEEYDQPVFVHGFPSAIKAFYMKPHPERPEVSLSVDLLAPEGYGEIIGGGQRLDDLDLLLRRIKEHDLPQEAFEWYLDLRRYGSVPHAGFGMGIERVVTWICGIDHLREAIPYPRMLYRMYP